MKIQWLPEQRIHIVSKSKRDKSNICVMHMCHVLVGFHLVLILAVI